MSTATDYLIYPQLYAVLLRTIHPGVQRVLLLVLCTVVWQPTFKPNDTDTHQCVTFPVHLLQLELDALPRKWIAEYAHTYSCWSNFQEQCCNARSCEIKGRKEERTKVKNMGTPLSIDTYVPPPHTVRHVSWSLSLHANWPCLISNSRIHMHGSRFLFLRHGWTWRGYCLSPVSLKYVGGWR